MNQLNYSMGNMAMQQQRPLTGYVISFLQLKGIMLVIGCPSVDRLHRLALQGKALLVVGGGIPVVTMIIYIYIPFLFNE